METSNIILSIVIIIAISIPIYFLYKEYREKYFQKKYPPGKRKEESLISHHAYENDATQEFALIIQKQKYKYVRFLGIKRHKQGDSHCSFYYKLQYEYWN